jgi:hypothetical protein
MILRVEPGGGLTREVETPLPSNSPHDHMILRVDLVGSQAVAFVEAHGGGQADAHTCMRFLDYVLAVPAAAAQTMLADVALVRPDQVRPPRAVGGVGLTWL